MKKLIDLHMHSTASDGTVKPDKLMEAAAVAGIGTLSLTDHDTTAGLEEAKSAAEGLGLEFIPGIELGTNTEYGQVDVLGYYVPMNDEKLEARLAQLRAGRDQRNGLILQKLAKLDLPVSPAELAAEGKSSFGRPHIASLMLRKGYVGSVREAFERYLGEGKPAYVPKEYLTPAEAVSLLKEVGAVPVIAHPMLIRAPWEWLDDLVEELAPLGLAGLEAYHSEHDNRGVRSTLALADKYGLIVTGGSDFHGGPKPSIALGVGKGGLRVPETVLVSLKRLRKAGTDIE